MDELGDQLGEGTRLIVGNERAGIADDRETSVRKRRWQPSSWRGREQPALAGPHNQDRAFEVTEGSGGSLCSAARFEVYSTSGC
jgi:hypothetical protein